MAAVRSVEPLSTTMISSTNGGTSPSTFPIPTSSLRQGMTTVMRRFLYIFYYCSAVGEAQARQRAASRKTPATVSAPDIGETVGVTRSSFDGCVQGEI